MARKATACTVQARLDNGVAVVVNASQPVDPINGATTATTVAAVTAAAAATEISLAVLEADAASPTQAHVNAFRVLYDVLAAAITANAANIATVPAQRSVVISYDATVVVSKSTLRQAIEHLLNQLPATL